VRDRRHTRRSDPAVIGEVLWLRTNRRRKQVTLDLEITLQELNAARAEISRLKASIHSMAESAAARSVLIQKIREQCDMYTGSLYGTEARIVADDILEVIANAMKGEADAQA
jgi:4-hydroxy-L-threonine phosphate dehydrogenase PdxA